MEAFVPAKLDDLLVVVLQLDAQVSVVVFADEQQAVLGGVWLDVQLAVVQDAQRLGDGCVLRKDTRSKCRLDDTGGSLLQGLNTQWIGVYIDAVGLFHECSVLPFVLGIRWIFHVYNSVVVCSHLNHFLITRCIFVTRAVLTVQRTRDTIV